MVERTYNQPAYQDPNTGLWGSDEHVPPAGQVVINGTGFGVKTGYSDSIKSAGILDLAEGSNFGAVGRWSGADYQGSVRPTVENEGINGKCLKFSRAPAGALNCVLAFNYDSAVDLNKKIFSSRWIKHYAPSSTLGGQIKYERYQVNTASVSDKASECYWNASSKSPDNKIQSRNYLGLGAATDKAAYGLNDVDKMPHNKNAWFRMDTLITLPAAYGDTTFKFESWVYYDPAQTPLYTNFVPPAAGINPYGQSGDRWLQHIFQNYAGGADSSGDFSGIAHTFWMDKVFETVGDDACYVDFCDTEIYSNRKIAYVQMDSLWSDTQIIIPEMDYGTLTNGWLHVVRNGTSIFSQAV